MFLFGESTIGGRADGWKSLPPQWQTQSFFPWKRCKSHVPPPHLTPINHISLLWAKSRLSGSHSAAGPSLRLEPVATKTPSELHPPWRVRSTLHLSFLKFFFLFLVCLFLLDWKSKKATDSLWMCEMVNDGESGLVYTGRRALNAVCYCVCVCVRVRVRVCTSVIQNGLRARVCVCERDECVRLHTLLAVFTHMRVHYCSIIVKICKINMILFKKYIYLYCKCFSFFYLRSIWLDFSISQKFVVGLNFLWNDVQLWKWNQEESDIFSAFTMKD